MKIESIPKWIAVGIAVMTALSGAGFTIFQVMTHEDRLVVVEDKVAKAEVEHADDEAIHSYYVYRLDELAQDNVDLKGEVKSGFSEVKALIREKGTAPP
jgi:hypothetical protein